MWVRIPPAPPVVALCEPLPLRLPCGVRGWGWRVLVSGSRGWRAAVVLARPRGVGEVGEVGVAGAELGEFGGELGEAGSGGGVVHGAVLECGVVPADRGLFAGDLSGDGVGFGLPILLPCVVVAGSRRGWRRAGRGVRTGRRRGRGPGLPLRGLRAAILFHPRNACLYRRATISSSIRAVIEVRWWEPPSTWAVTVTTASLSGEIMQSWP